MKNIIIIVLTLSVILQFIFINLQKSTIKDLITAKLAAERDLQNNYIPKDSRPEIKWDCPEK